MIATNAGRDAVAAGPFARRARNERTVKPCGPVPPTLGIKPREAIARRRGLTSPVPRGEHGVSRKPIAQGMPDVSVNLW